MVNWMWMSRLRKQQQPDNKDGFIIVRLYEDEQLTPDGSHYTLKEQPLWSSTRKYIYDNDDRMKAVSSIQHLQQRPLPP